MSEFTVLKSIEDEWDLENGFFGNLRQGKFKEHLFDRLMQNLRELDFSNYEKIDKRTVSLLWYISPFMNWQETRVQESGFDMMRYARAVNEIHAVLENKLGIP